MEYKGYTIEIEPDDDPMNPREWDHLGIMVCAHNRYSLGDKQLVLSEGHFQKGGIFLPNCHSWDDVATHLMKRMDARVVLPLFLMDHSGITMRTTSATFRMADSAGWDWGQVGFIYVDGKTLRKEYSVSRVTAATIKKATEVLQAEVIEYDKYLTGGYCCYIVKNEAGDVVDSLCGCDSEEYAISEAKAHIDYLTAE